MSKLASQRTIKTDRQKDEQTVSLVLPLQVLPRSVLGCVAAHGSVYYFSRVLLGAKTISV